MSIEEYRISVLNEDFILQTSAPYYNPELFEIQVRGDMMVAGYAVTTVSPIADDSGVYVQIVDPGVEYRAAAETVALTTAAAHDASLSTTEQMINIQKANAQIAARDGLYSLRSEEDPSDMWAIKLGRIYRDHEGDAYTINTPVQALTYINTKFRQMFGEVSDQVIIENGGGTPAWNVPAGRLANAIRTIFDMIMLVSEWDSDGSND